ncbi:MAG: HPP family protein [Dehalococcoidia bacterium]|nr:MAG: HPP family protein [Dehalococcoidia bacterium]
MAENERSYFDKWKGAKGLSGIPYPKLSAIILSGLGGLVTILLIAGLSLEAEFLCLIVPLGATCVLIFAAPAAPFSQPRNVVLGHLLAALVGLAFFCVLGSAFWVAALANGVAIALMVATKTVHPPAGATALIPVLTANGAWLWAFYPAALGAIICVLIGLIYNNAIKGRVYPAFWW